MSSKDLSLVQKGRKQVSKKNVMEVLSSTRSAYSFGSWPPAKNFYVLVKSEENFILL